MVLHVRSLTLPLISCLLLMGSHGLVVHSASPSAVAQERQCVHESDELQSLLCGFEA